MNAPLWQPSPQQIKSTQMFQFMQNINQKYQQSTQSYEELHHWSVNNAAEFWNEIWDFCDLRGDKQGEIVSNANQMPGARWFPDSKINFAENLLRFRDDHTALVFRNETDQRRSLTYKDLFAEVAQYASSMKKMGVGQGDVVAGFMPNIPEAVIAMLAATSLGAVWTSCSPDFGINGVMERFGQVKPKLLFSASGYLYSGKVIDCLPKVQQIAEQLDSTEQIVIVPYITEPKELSAINNACFASEFIDNSATELQFNRVEFSAPLYVMYSSGTTGVPKCIVHGVGGTLIQHLKEHQLHCDLRRSDTLFYFTTCGWMMWNWLVSGLATGCTVVLYDGSPFAPSAEHLWDIAEKEQISLFGTSAKYISALEKAGIKPKQSHNLEPLRVVLSTGSPLAHESFEYVYREIKQDLLLASISGGTDIISCFALGCPIKPVYSGELQCRGLGLDVQVYDEQGKAITAEKGELVCQAPFPSMPIYFWNDPENRKFHDAYFVSFENIWAHGDYAELTKHNGLIIHGRSDAVLNPGGVRIGTAEIYRQVDKVEQVQDAICIGQPWQDDVRVVLFVVLKGELQLNEELITLIKKTILKNTSPRHVPAKVIQVQDIPRTISGKIVELAVRKTVLGEEVKNKDALANPEALKQFENIAELAE
ncbi:acetoacetate--CoA ligase [Neptuniibacter sp.]|uniref:acetoacetate--CoA ligase n=1 Tax=Neptuniibacter sp. TaxID=1962643 RepID=UPI00260B0B81|nr:acetoacetate--CoA ligase [Neptuniibacter sp.]MCP4596762.1 acetoacetate--CoA ligase [Neptuniibacter sp.]